MDTTSQPTTQEDENMVKKEEKGAAVDPKLLYQSPKDAIFLSHVTRHETQAEIELMRAADDQRRLQRQRDPKRVMFQQRVLRPSSRATLDALDTAVTPLPQPPATATATPTTTSENKRETLKQTRGTLAARTQYLVALHEEDGKHNDDNGDDTGDNDDKASSSVFLDLNDVTHSERLVHVLKKAAFNEKSNKKLQSPSFGTQAQSTSPNNNIQDNDESLNAYMIQQVESYDTDLDPRPAVGANTMHNASSRQSWLPILNPVKDEAIREASSLHDFFSNRPARGALEFASIAILSMIVAIVLFYWLGNPPTGKCRPDGSDDTCGLDVLGNPLASASYWVLFVGVREPIIIALSVFSDIFFLDWLLMHHLWIIRLLGPRLSLIFVQSKGWPFVMFWWGLWSSIFMHGNGRFAQHWLYYQNTIGMFNATNPPGGLTTASLHTEFIIAAFVISATVSLKRNFVGLYLGRRLYGRYNERLQEAMKEIALIAELCIWARTKRKKNSTYSRYLHKHPRKEVSFTRQKKEIVMPGKDGDETKTSFLAPGSRERIDYNAVLEPWDEPLRGDPEEVSGNHIIEFRQAFAVMTRHYFFSSAFGSVDSREDCIKSAIKVFYRLEKLMGVEKDDPINLYDLSWWMMHRLKTEEDKIHADELVELFQPNNQGYITGLEFVQAIDRVYKKVRLLENAVNNASHVDRNYEKLINLLFYLVLGAIILAILALDTLKFIFALSAVILAFSFMIGSASSQVFEGVLLVIARQPFDIGDKIAMGNVDDMPKPDGQQHWMVEDIQLSSTTCRLMGTNEVASFSNGSIARARIFNMNRSPTAVVSEFVRFGTDIPYSTILVFKAAVEKFVEDRPQEWIGCLGFRTNRIEEQENFVEYKIVLQHRQSWQNLVAVKESTATVSSFCVEIQKQLGARYSAPSMPIDITMDSLPNDLQTFAQDRAKQDVGTSDASIEDGPIQTLAKLMEAADQFRSND